MWSSEPAVSPGRSGRKESKPTHASSRVGALEPDAHGAPYFQRERGAEMKAILDQLTGIERLAPGIAGRLVHARIAVAGHSLGGHTTGLLPGARVQGEDFRDPRISAGLMLAAPGRGGGDLTPESPERFAFFDVDFQGLTTPTLVVCGDEDQPRFTPRGPDSSHSHRTLPPNPYRNRQQDAFSPSKSRTAGVRSVC